MSKGSRAMFRTKVVGVIPAQPPIGLELARVARTVSRAFDDALAEAGGSLSEWLVLLNLKIRPAANQRQLADAVGIKLSAKQAVVNTTVGVDNVAAEAMACLHTLLDNADRYYVDRTLEPSTIFVDSTGIAATDFGLTPAQQQTLFDNGQAAALAWIKGP